MGSSNSVTVNENKQTVINKSQLDILNEMITNQIANSQINQGTDCGSTIVSKQYMDFGPITAKGPITISNISQYQGTSLAFSCKQNQDAVNDISNQLYNQIQNAMNTSINTQILAELEAQAAANVKSGFASWGGGSSHSDSKNIVDWNVQTDISQELSNIIKNSIEYNFTTNNLSECNSKIIHDQELIFSSVNSITGDVWVGNLDQKDVTDSYVECIQNQQVAQEITNVIANATGTEVIDDTDTGTKSRETGTATSETINNGPFEGIGEIIGSIFSGLAGLLGNLRELSMLSAILIALLCCCFIFALFGWFILSGTKPQEIVESTAQAAKVAELAAIGGYSSNFF